MAKTSKSTENNQPTQAVQAMQTTEQEQKQNKKTSNKKQKVQESKDSNNETVSTQQTQTQQTQTQETLNKNDTKEQEKNTNDQTNTSELRFSQQYTAIQEEIKFMREKLGGLTISLRKLESAYNADIKKVKKTKQKRNFPHKATGFAKAKPVPEKLAKFIGVNPGTELTGPQVTKKVWSQLKEKGLTYDKDKRVFRTNAEVSELFNVPKSVNKSTDHKDKMGFNFCNLQKFIANALK